ncbi:hypothetical protein CKO42_08215 [Lamprobacter modestohalophilus]|uniref:Uncharacterized protein n=1 Tax=Lamprobacter modestohalophilus TaxID=1064514 RepID=A0A9X1B4A9_9GAMM|nr:hypothetical protein [Lamprobacter modestohalophilus]
MVDGEVTVRRLYKQGQAFVTSLPALLLMSGEFYLGHAIRRPDRATAPRCRGTGAVDHGLSLRDAAPHRSLSDA